MPFGFLFRTLLLFRWVDGLWISLESFIFLFDLICFNLPEIFFYVAVELREMQNRFIQRDLELRDLENFYFSPKK